MTDFYVVPETNGGAPTGAGSQLDPWNGLDNIDWTSVNGNIIYFVGTFLLSQESGSMLYLDNKITTRTHIIGTGINLAERSYNGDGCLIDCETLSGITFLGADTKDVSISNFKISNPQTTGLEFKTGTGHIVTNIISNNSGNQSFNCDAAEVEAVFNNIEGYNNADDGFSMHGGSVVINTGLFWDNKDGINTAAPIETRCDLEANNIIIENSSNVDVAAAGAGANITINSFTINSAPSDQSYGLYIGEGKIRLNGGIISLTGYINSAYIRIDTTGGEFEACGVLFKNYDKSNGVFIEHRAGTASVDNCTFIGGVPQDNWGFRSTGAGEVLSIRNNIYSEMRFPAYNSGTAIYSNVDTNCLHNCESGFTNITSENDLITDPIFIGGGDYNLQDNSPCKGTGLSGITGNYADSTEIGYPFHPNGLVYELPDGEVGDETNPLAIIYNNVVAEDWADYTYNAASADCSGGPGWEHDGGGTTVCIV